MSRALATSPWERRAAGIADLLTWATAARPPTLGSGRLVCVDGRAGSGKSTLGRALLAAATELGSARLLEVDHMLDGWSGLATVSGRIDRELVGPLREGRAGRYQRYDWDRERFAEWHTVEPVDTLILEGCGSGASSYRDAVTTLVWVEAPRELRLKRGIARDGEELRPQWLRWMDDEDAVFSRERTRERADVVVDGTGELDRAVVFC
ncbi:MAG: uridine kinase family protein [Nocardioidaceae bacterium]